MSDHQASPQHDQGAPLVAPGDEVATTTASASTILPASLVWQVPLVLGIIHLVLGIAVLVWPEATITVVVVLVGLELVFGGVLRLVLALVDRTVEARLMRGVLGLLSVLAGVLVVSQPLRSVGLVVVLLGAFWVIWGLVELFVSLLPSAAGQRGALALEGVLAAGFGAILLAWPEPSIRVVTVVVGIGFVLVGLVATLAGWSARGLVKRATA